MEPITLQTDRLLLRPFLDTDVDAVFAYAKDPEWGKFLPVPKPYEFQHAEQFIERCISTSFEKQPILAIVHKNDVIGGVNCRINQTDLIAELGYSLRRDFWGQGLVVEAVEAILHWLFKNVGLEKVYAEADIENSQSWRVMEKVGMSREGVLRSHRASSHMVNSRQDVVVYSILRDEFQLSG